MQFVLNLKKIDVIGDTMILIGVIVGLAVVALLLASVSLFLIRRNRRPNLPNFAKTSQLKSNIYTHHPNTVLINTHVEGGNIIDIST